MFQELREGEESDNLQENSKMYFCRGKNILVVKVDSSLKVQDIYEKSFKWNRFVEKYEKEDYTGHYRYWLTNDGKVWNIKINVTQEEGN